MRRVQWRRGEVTVEANRHGEPEAPFPTVWTSLPARTPLLVAWAGGPKALRLSGSSHEEIVSHALHTLRLLFGRRVPVKRYLEAVHWHDWQRDPFACGAYSYPLAGSSAATRRQLSRPVAETLFFAGEATEPEESASVGGAINSGRRAARELLRTVGTGRGPAPRKGPA